MSIASNTLLSTINSSKEPERNTNKLAKVSKIEGASTYITFYGEEEMSQLPYKRVSTYTPVVGDTVIVQKIGTSYIITGKVV